MGLRRSGLVLLLLGACGSSPTQGAKDPIELGRRLATDQRDWQARRDLAKLRYDDGQWGQALREYLIVERQERLSSEDRQTLAILLSARAKERLEAGDAGALDDLQHAERLGANVERLLPDTLLLAALAELRHSSAFTKERAKGHLNAFAEFAPEDPRIKHAQLAELSPEEVSEVFRWFHQAGSKRQALRVAQHYVEVGGRDTKVLDAWLALHRWWYGTRFPPLPSEAAALATSPASTLERARKDLAATQRAEPRAKAASLARDFKLDAWAETLEQIASAYQGTPARADTLAQQFIDKPVYGAKHMLVLAELYYRLGDSSRAKALALELLVLAPAVPAYGLVAGVASVLDGDLAPADQYFIRAAAASGDPGRYWAIAGRALRRSGYALESIAANRRAMALTAPGDDLAILLEVSLAQAAIGRVDQAAATESALLGRVPEAEQPALAELVRLAKVAETSQLSSILEPLRFELGL